MDCIIWRAVWRTARGTDGGQISTYCKTEIDCTKFPNLRECGLYWRPRAKSLFGCGNLKRLVIDHYSGKENDLSLFSRLANLESLSIMNSRIISLKGIEKLNKLRFLGLYNLRKLNSLEGIERLSSLSHLEVNGCRAIGTIAPVKHLKLLKRIHFCNDNVIDTLRHISELKGLEEVLFYDNTNIKDGDLTPLISLPKLHNISFQDRKHYSHTLKNIMQSRNID